MNWTWTAISPSRITVGRGQGGLCRANENLNGLVRQYFSKSSSFEQVTQQRVDEVTEKLNQRPRKRFGYRSPNEVFNDALQNKGSVAFIT